jgi:hypothetical protein
MPPRNRWEDPVGRWGKQRFGSPKRRARLREREREMIAGTPPSSHASRPRPTSRTAPRLLLSPRPCRLFPGHMPLELGTGLERHRRAAHRHVVVAWPAAASSFFLVAQWLKSARHSEISTDQRSPPRFGWLGQRSHISCLLSWSTVKLMRFRQHDQRW